MSNIKLTFLERDVCGRCKGLYPKVHNFAIDQGIELDKRNIDEELSEMDRQIMHVYGLRALPIMYFFDGDAVLPVDPNGESLREAYQNLLDHQKAESEKEKEQEKNKEDESRDGE